MSARTEAAAAAAYLVKGDDPSVVAQEVRALLARVVGDRDHALVVEEIGGAPGDELNVGAIVDACLTPPFLVDRRVVVVRDAGRLLTADVPRLVEVVQNPLPTTVLILVGGGGTVPAPLVKAVGAAGEVVDVTTGKAGDRKKWLHDHLRSAPVKLEPGASELLAEHVGGEQAAGVTDDHHAPVHQEGRGEAGVHDGADVQLVAGGTADLLHHERMVAVAHHAGKQRPHLLGHDGGVVALDQIDRDGGLGPRAHAASLTAASASRARHVPRTSCTRTMRQPHAMPSAAAPMDAAPRSVSSKSSTLPKKVLLDAESSSG